MNNKKSTKKLVAYEIYNIIGNPFSSFFGIVFPILMLLIITNAIKGDVPKSMAAQANTSIFITMSLITPDGHHLSRLCRYLFAGTGE